MGDVAELTWTGRDGEVLRGRLLLPAELDWSAHRGETDPVLGWYSPRFGSRVPTTTLVGAGSWTSTLELRTALVLAPHSARAVAPVASTTARERVEEVAP
jgi:hypothetical protein